MLVGTVVAGPHLQTQLQDLLQGLSGTTAKGQDRGVLLEGVAIEPRLHWDVTERAYVGGLGQAEDRGALSPLHGNQMLSGKQEATAWNAWVGSSGGVQSTAAAPDEVFM